LIPRALDQLLAGDQGDGSFTAFERSRCDGKGNTGCPVASIDGRRYRA
jgi:hypothetical protein